MHRNHWILFLCRCTGDICFVSLSITGAPQGWSWLSSHWHVGSWIENARKKSAQGSAEKLEWFGGQIKGSMTKTSCVKWLASLTACQDGFELSLKNMDKPGIKDQLLCTFVFWHQKNAKSALFEAIYLHDCKLPIPVPFLWPVYYEASGKIYFAQCMLFRFPSYFN